MSSSRQRIGPNEEFLKPLYSEEFMQLLHIYEGSLEVKAFYNNYDYIRHTALCVSLTNFEIFYTIDYGIKTEGKWITLSEVSDHDCFHDKIQFMSDNPILTIDLCQQRKLAITLFKTLLDIESYPGRMKFYRLFPSSKSANCRSAVKLMLKKIKEVSIANEGIPGWVFQIEEYKCTMEYRNIIKIVDTYVLTSFFASRKTNTDASQLRIIQFQNLFKRRVSKLPRPVRKKIINNNKEVKRVLNTFVNGGAFCDGIFEDFVMTILESHLA